MEGDVPVLDDVFELMSHQAENSLHPCLPLKEKLQRIASRTTAVLAGGKRIKWRGYPTKQAA